MRKKPLKSEIREWVKNSITQWFLERLSFHLNEIDTVRNINPENIDEALARKMALEIVENAIADVYEAGDLVELQKKVSEEEDNILRRIKEISKEQY